MLRRHELLRFARTGAEARLQELKREIESIYAAFPDLRGRLGRPQKQAAGRRAKGRRRRQAWSAAQRKAVSDRMRKYWAARKAAGNK
jgi:hypothetical protein